MQLSYSPIPPSSLSFSFSFSLSLSLSLSFSLFPSLFPSPSLSPPYRDAVGMAKDVWSAWVSIISDHLSVSEAETETKGEREGGKKVGEKVLEEMKNDHRYLVDAWTS